MNEYNRYKDLAENHLQNFIESEINNGLKNFSKGSLESLYDALRYVISGGGKRIRPVLLMLATEAFGGDVEDSLDAAIAVEILHNFTLVHDDIMDNASTRRGRPTVHTKYDVSSAILVGDELIALSYRSLLNVRNGHLPQLVNIFTNGVIEVCEGQAMDKYFENNNNVTLDDYIVMIRKKTAELLKTCTLLGSTIAGASQYEIDMMGSYAENLGIAFQINDDLLDLIAEEINFGKKTGSDIIERKKTFLYLKSNEILPLGERKRLFELYNLDDSNSRVDEIIKIYRASCVIESAKEEVRKYTQRANSFLSVVNNKKARMNLEQFSDMLLNRNF